ncbi:hypothetical protein V7S43_008272 [Phytophthora oleae]|uniref:Uncharacterized protein n=1 Tax=Phytophthora oleae TaxID=2107226 RepID=A0ABD3FLC1_9STRA
MRVIKHLQISSGREQRAERPSEEEEEEEGSSVPDEDDGDADDESERRGLTAEDPPGIPEPGASKAAPNPNMDCSTCGARVVPPPVTLDGLGLQLLRCACCKQPMAYEAFTAGTGRELARHCKACASGP